MNVARLLKMPAVVHRHSQAEGGGGIPVDAWTPDAEATRGWIDLRGRTTESSEVPAPTDFQVETVDVFLLPDDTVTGRDRVAIGGVTYEALGPPHTFTHPVDLTSVYTHVVGRRID